MYGMAGDLEKHDGREGMEIRYQRTEKRERENAEKDGKSWEACAQSECVTGFAGKASMLY